jgi:hypothetical protein
MKNFFSDLKNGIQKRAEQLEQDAALYRMCRDAMPKDTIIYHRADLARAMAKLKATILRSLI